jgi:hypothetical protein
MITKTKATTIRTRTRVTTIPITISLLLTGTLITTTEKI